jgi:hypothetical protein
LGPHQCSRPSGSVLRHDCSMSGTVAPPSSPGQPMLSATTHTNVNASQATATHAAPLSYRRRHRRMIHRPYGGIVVSPIRGVCVVDERSTGTAPSFWGSRIGFAPVFKRERECRGSGSNRAARQISSSVALSGRETMSGMTACSVPATGGDGPLTASLAGHPLGWLERSFLGAGLGFGVGGGPSRWSSSRLAAAAPWSGR